MHETELFYHPIRYVHCFDRWKLDNEWWVAMVSSFDSAARMDSSWADHRYGMDRDLYLCHDSRAYGVQCGKTGTKDDDCRNVFGERHVECHMEYIVFWRTDGRACGNRDDCIGRVRGTFDLEDMASLAHRGVAFGALSSMGVVCRVLELCYLDVK